MGHPFDGSACFEIQARTVLEHAWAEIEHDLGYKATEAIPEGVRRRLSRLAGLLELADQEFGAIRSDLERYARALPERIQSSETSVPLDRFSLAALIDHRENEAIDQSIASSLGKSLGDLPFYPEYLLKMLLASRLRTTDDVRRGLRENEAAIVKMVQPYFELTEALWALSPRQMTDLPRGYALFFLAHASVLRASTLRLERIERLAQLYRELDYPDDPQAAHDVARRLVDAFQAVGLA